MRTVTSSSAAGAPPPRRAGTARRGGAAGLAAVMALGTVPALTALGTAAHGAVSVGENISVFPNRDMVVATGYIDGEQLLVEVLRNDVVVGTTQGPAASTPEGVGLEVNHGPLGTPQPGDCWTNYTPDIIRGDVIRVTAVDRPGAPSDTMTVKDLAFTSDPFVDGDNVSIMGTATPGLSFAVEFRRDKPAPRFRRGPFAPVFDATTADPNDWKATFRIGTENSAEGLTPQQQRDIALNEASWLAVADQITETTLAEHGEPGGVGPGCNGSNDPNTLVGGLEPINITSGDVTFSGTTRAGVAAVSVTVGALGSRPATVTPNPDPTGTNTWTLTVPKSELATLPDGNVTVTPSFDGAAGVPRTVLKDTVAPAAPTATPAPGTYSTAQSVTLNKPATEATSSIRWTIGGSTVANPTATSASYTAGQQISVTASQTIKGRVIDAAGNLGAVGTFAYTIGPPNIAPTVTGRSPSASATSVAGANNITATFSEAVTGVTTTTFAIRPGTATTGSFIAGTVSRNGTTNQWILNPTANLANDTRYTVTLTGGTTAIRDTAGAPLATTSWSFVTGPAPTITSRTPATSATSVNVASNVTATFSEALAAAPTGANVAVRLGTSSTGTLVPAVVGYNATTRVVTVNPNANLANDTRYSVWVTGLRDVAGNPLPATSWTFLTGPAPTVTARTPGINATNVGRTANVTATFSEALAAAPTTANASLRLGTAATGTLVSSAVTYNATTRVATLNPGVTLAARTVYTVRITGLRDRAGNLLPATTWSFTTGA